MQKLAKKYEVEPGTILISYLVARGIPGKSRPHTNDAHEFAMLTRLVSCFPARRQPFPNPSPLPESSKTSASSNSTKMKLKNFQLLRNVRARTRGLLRLIGVLISSGRRMRSSVTEDTTRCWSSLLYIVTGAKRKNVRLFIGYIEAAANKQW